MMTVKLQSEVFRKEEKYKDLVYQQLDAMVEYADGDEKRQQKYVLSGAFEDQDAFAAHRFDSEAAAARKIFCERLLTNICSNAIM